MSFTKTEKDIIKLLRSGNFTVIGQDSGSYNIMEGKFKCYEDCFDEDGEPMGDMYDVDEFGGSDCGYVGAPMVYLIEALKGKYTSI